MLRRPNRASWHEESAGSPSPLARLLATPQPVRSVHADTSFVGARHNLPGQIGFGPTHQHPVEGTAFTGGRVANPQVGLVHGPSMPTFSQANQAGPHAGGGVAASLAALGLLADTPHGGGATPTLPPGPGTLPPVPPAPPGPGPTGATPTTTLNGEPPHGGVFGPPTTRPDPGTTPGPLNTGLGSGGLAGHGGSSATGGYIDPNHHLPAGVATALGQLLVSIGKRGVYNV